MLQTVHYPLVYLNKIKFVNDRNHEMGRVPTEL